MGEEAESPQPSLNASLRTLQEQIKGGWRAVWGWSQGPASVTVISNLLCCILIPKEQSRRF